jgi:hypothetical protein
MGVIVALSTMIFQLALILFCFLVKSGHIKVSAPS